MVHLISSPQANMFSSWRLCLSCVIFRFLFSDVHSLNIVSGPLRQSSPKGPTSKHGHFSVYSLVKDQEADEDHRSLIRGIMSPNMMPGAEMTLSSNGDHVVLPPPANLTIVQEPEAETKVHGRRATNSSRPTFSPSSDSVAQSSNASSRTLPQHSNSANVDTTALPSATSKSQVNYGFNPQLSGLPFSWQTNREKAQEELLKLSASSNSDHIHDILNRFRGNQNGSSFPHGPKIKGQRPPGSLWEMQASAVPTKATTPISSFVEYDILPSEQDTSNKTTEAETDLAEHKSEQSDENTETNEPVKMHKSALPGPASSQVENKQRQAHHTVTFTQDEMRHLNDKRAGVPMGPPAHMSRPKPSSDHSGGEHSNVVHHGHFSPGHSSGHLSTAHSNTSPTPPATPRPHATGNVPEKEENDIIMKSQSEGQHSVRPDTVEKVENVVHISNSARPPEVSFGDHMYIPNPPPNAFAKLRPRNPFQLGSPFLPFPPKFTLRPPPMAIPMQLPRYYTTDDSYMKYNNLEAHADTKPEHVESEHDEGSPIKEGSFTPSQSQKGDIINEATDGLGHHSYNDIGLHGHHGGYGYHGAGGGNVPGLHPQVIVPSGPHGGPGVHHPPLHPHPPPGAGGLLAASPGSMVTCCKTFFQPYHDATAGATAGPGFAGKEPEAMTTCFHEPILPNPLYLKQLKLQQLLYPFMLKKRLLFG
ncbi:hypothetical protein HDE_07332 [Halotydeus destructor]|nr:hypothetical protein HDE_07332 [Halotydeus destructor]